MPRLYPSDLKYFICLFKMEGHETWRLQTGKSIQQIEQYLKSQLGTHIVTAKKFFEIDRITGSFEEF